VFSSPCNVINYDLRRATCCNTEKTKVVSWIDLSAAKTPLHRFAWLLCWYFELANEVNNAYRYCFLVKNRATTTQNNNSKGRCSALRRSSADPFLEKGPNKKLRTFGLRPYRYRYRVKQEDKSSLGVRYPARASEDRVPCGVAQKRSFLLRHAVLHAVITVVHTLVACFACCTRTHNYTEKNYWKRPIIWCITLLILHTFIH
jgi:hypothetical protein